MNDFEKNNKVENSNKSEKKPKKWSPGNGYFIGIGIALGVAMGAAFDNIAMGIVLGVAIGAALDWNRDKEQK
ncbi:MAG: hypothetical protein RBT41_10370 [Clostridia bacterium]|jgi:hypothetical protein|nr:hypothetical protein [Clostridia bacterium]